MAIRSWQDAELVARDFLRLHGFPDAQLTGDGADSGVDARSAAAVAQVKAQTSPVGRPVIQAIKGVAAAELRIPMVFSLAGFTRAAIEWANQADVALFEFNYESQVVPVNPAASRISAGDSNTGIGVLLHGVGTAPTLGRWTAGQLKEVARTDKRSFAHTRQKELRRLARILEPDERVVVLIAARRDEGLVTGLGLLAFTESRLIWVRGRYLTDPYYLQVWAYDEVGAIIIDNLDHPGGLEVRAADGTHRFRHLPGDASKRLGRLVSP